MTFRQLEFLSTDSTDECRFCQLTYGDSADLPGFQLARIIDSDDGSHLANPFLCTICDQKRSWLPAP